MITAAPAHQNLLIVDDESAQLRTLGDIFTDEGFQVQTCLTFQEALDRCHDHSFAVAVLDLRLSGRDGIELLGRIRRAQSGIKVIIHTAYGSFDSAKDAVNLGAYAYVEKSGSPAELISHVHRAAKESLSDALYRSDQRYHDLLDDVGAIVWECELPSWRFTFVSRHAEPILGYPMAQWLQEREFWINLIHDDDRQRCIELRTRCTELGQDYEFDYRTIAADGRTVWLRDVVHVVESENGERTHLRGVMVDITGRKLAEESLRASEARFRTIVETTQEWIWEIDLNGVHTYSNPAVETILGYSVSEVVGHSSMRMMIEDDRARVEQALPEFIKHARGWSGWEIRWRHKDGGVRYLESNAVPIHNDDGQFCGYRGADRDITARIEAEEAVRNSERSLANAQQIARIGSWHFDYSTGRVSTSAELRRMLGASETDFMEHDVFSLMEDFVHPDDREFVKSMYDETLSTGIIEPLEFRVRRPSDDQTYVVRAETEVVLGPDDSLQQIVGTLQDITERRAAEVALRASEEQLRELNASLEQRVVERTAELAETNAELAAYAHSVSHDLRAPLRAMEGFAGALLEDYGDRLDEEGREFIRHIAHSARRMDALTNDLLVYSQLGRAEIQLEPVDLTRSVDDAISQLASLIETCGARVDVAEQLPLVSGHRRIMAQAITNLLSNAVKFVADGARPEVRIWAERRDDFLIRLWFEDNGIGVDEDNQDRIFCVFERLHGIESYSGTGIGLALVSRSCERLGGRCGVESRLGEGSRFWVEFQEWGSSGRPHAAPQHSSSRLT